MTTNSRKRIADPRRTRHPDGRPDAAVWLPACLSTELTADGDPLRLMLLGEKLIAFRDSAGADRRPRSPLPASLCLLVLRPQ